jgi:predicted dehydrogenase
MRIAFVGCGYVADFYAKTLANHPGLELIAVADRDAGRAAHFAAFYRVPRFGALASIVEDPNVDIVVNLTNPDSHFEVSKAALEAGKHVYSEKPLAMSLAHAQQLVKIADSRGLQIAGAPCTVLGESAQTLWKTLRAGTIGKPRLLYAELDDGPVHLMDFKDWRSESGTPWPYKDEFEVGCTLEHAGYCVTWLVAFFGPARQVTSFAATLVPDKGVVLDRAAPDFSVGCIEFASGVVARLTCSIFAPHHHALRVIGDLGVLSVEDLWDFGSPVRLHRRTRLGLRAEKYPRASKVAGLGPRRLPLVRKPTFAFRSRGANRIDFARGVAELASAVRDGRPCRLSASFALHVNEIVLMLRNGATGALTTTSEPMEPMPWAKDPPS